MKSTQNIKKCMEKVGRKEVAYGVAHVEGITQTQAERIVDLVFKQILYLVIERKLVEIPGFGRFFGKYVEGKKGSHPQTHEEIDIEPRVQMRAEFSTNVKRSLKQYVDKFRELLEKNNG
jgi:nucleoid DNA-binding protein